MPKTLLTFVDDLYEDLELWYPLLRLQGTLRVSTSPLAVDWAEIKARSRGMIF